jgi:hypothetical protein
VVIPNLTYQTVFVGSIWHNAYLAAQADQLDAALNAALSSTSCNAVFTQYFPTGTMISASPNGKYDTLDVAWPEIVYRDDLKSMAQKLLNDGLLPASALDSFALVLVLPPGTILSIDAERGTIPNGLNSMEGLGAYHGQLTLQQSDGTPLPMYFCVAAWSDGSNGTAVPAWDPWENTCAALYHELGEVRLCPKIDNAPTVKHPPVPAPPITGLGWLAWYQSPDQDEGGWQEAGDLAVIWAGALPQKVFCKGAINQLTDVPIQALWSNALKTPFIPQGFTPQHSW